jgi:release factor glutamine methyltransferase
MSAASFIVAGGASRNEAMAAVVRLLSSCGVEEARFDARALLLAAAGISLTQLALDPDAPLGEEAAGRLCRYAARRAAREPVSRILAARGFWTLDLEVAPRVLDPRADTETLIELALRLFSDRRGEPLRILDLGSGSGAIICALLSELPQAWGVAIDLSPDACALTKSNLAFCGLAGRASVIRSRWTDAIHARFDLVVSNPPYIKSGDLGGLAPEVRLHDPALALDGGADGLDCYREIIADLPRILVPEGVGLLEAGAGQASDICQLFNGVGLEPISTGRDAGGHERAVAARFANRKRGNLATV